MKRRDFLGKLGASYFAIASSFFDGPFRPRFRIARAATGKTLVVVFQIGGSDGLSTIVPYGDADYYNLRPTLAVAPPSIDPASAINLDGFFGLHPGIAAFESIYGAGDMAILPTVQYPNATRSHFAGQDLIQTAAAVKNQGLDGWLNRHLVSQTGNSVLRAVGYGVDEDAGLPESLRGSAIVSTFNDLTSFGLGLPQAEETALLQRLTPIYDQSPDPARLYAQLVHDFGRAVIDDVTLIGGIDFAGYVPENGAVYPNTVLGNQMKQTAQLIKAGVGLEVAALTTENNWDTHSNQGAADNPNGALYTELTDFGNSIAALYHDLGSLMMDVVVLTTTEFGRTARENASGGTDHGNASTWFVVSPAVQGGIYLGTGWPGLSPGPSGTLHDDRDLEHTIDYRDVYWEVLVRHLANTDPATVVPGHSYNPIGFLPDPIV